MGRGYSLSQIEEMAENGWSRGSSADSDLKELEDLHRLRQELLAANEGALTQWTAGQQEEALREWTRIYRTWLAEGRLIAGMPLDLRNQYYVVSDILRPQVEQLRAALIDLWAEILNNLGFALWSHKEWSQAQAVLDDCLTLLTATGHERNVLYLNRGDLLRDMGKGPEAINAYRSFLSRKVTAARRKDVDRLRPG